MRVKKERKKKGQTPMWRKRAAKLVNEYLHTHEERNGIQARGPDKKDKQPLA